MINQTLYKRLVNAQIDERAELLSMKYKPEAKIRYGVQNDET